MAPDVHSLAAQVIHRRFRRVHHRSHADDGVLRAFHPVLLQEIVTPPGQPAEVLEGVRQRRRHAVVEVALRHLALHVAVLVLHAAGEHRFGRVEQLAQPQLGIADEVLHQLFFRQPDRFQRVRRQKSVLDVHERRFAVLGGAPRDDRQVGGFLRVAVEQHAPAHVGHAHHVVMPGVHVQRMRGQRPRSDVKHHRQPLAADHVQHFLHQDQPLPGGEIGHSSAGQREAFARRRRAVLRLRLQEHHRLAPQVFRPVGELHREAVAHRRRGRNRIGARALRDVALHPHHRARSVGRRHHARIADFFGRLGRFLDFDRCCHFVLSSRAHTWARCRLYKVVMNSYEWCRAGVGPSLDSAWIRPAGALPSPRGSGGDETIPSWAPQASPSPLSLKQGFSPSIHGRLTPGAGQ